MQTEANLIFSGISDTTVRLGQRVLPAHTDTNTEMLNTSALKLNRSMLSRASNTPGTGIQGFLRSSEAVHSLQVAYHCSRKHLSESNRFLLWAD